MNRSLSGLVLALSMLLSACSGLRDASTQQAQIATQVESLLHHPPQSRPLVLDHQSAWMLGEETPALESQSPTLQRQVVFAASQGVPALNELVGWLRDNAGLAAVLDDSVLAPVAPAKTIASAPHGAARVDSSILSSSAPFHYQGSLHGLLDLVTAQHQAWWSEQKGTVHFYRTRTEVLVLPRVPKAVAMTGAISSDSGGAGSGGGSVEMKFSKSVDLMASLRTAAEAQAGAGARVVVDPDWGTVTVTATPPQLERVKLWFEQVANMLSKQVAIEVRVMNVALSGEDNYGLNLGLASVNAAGNKLNLSSQLTPALSSNASALTLGASIVSGPRAGSTAVVQALSSLGKVSELYSRSGVTPNGQVLGLQDAETFDYVSSTTTTTSAVGGSSTSMQSSSITGGFTSTFLPRVVGDRIDLDISMKIADVLPFKTFASGSSSSSSGQSSVQLKDVKTSVELASVSLRPGESLLIVGDRKQTANTANNGVGAPWMPLLGGGVEAQRGDTVMAVVVTARLL